MKKSKCLKDYYEKFENCQLNDFERNMLIYFLLMDEEMYLYFKTQFRKHLDKYDDLNDLNFLQFFPN